MADLSGIGLHDLPQTREEVEEIGKIVGRDAVILIGKDATETAFKKEPLDQYRVLHLAVHASQTPSTQNDQPSFWLPTRNLVMTDCCKCARS